MFWWIQLKGGRTSSGSQFQKLVFLAGQAWRSISAATGLCLTCSSQLRRSGSTNTAEHQDRLDASKAFLRWQTPISHVSGPPSPPNSPSWWGAHIQTHKKAGRISQPNHLLFYTTHLQCCSPLEIFWDGFEFWLIFLGFWGFVVFLG